MFPVPFARTLLLLFRHVYDSSKHNSYSFVKPQNLEQTSSSLSNDCFSIIYFL